MPSDILPIHPPPPAVPIADFSITKGDIIKARKCSAESGRNDDDGKKIKNDIDDDGFDEEEEEEDDDDDMKKHGVDNDVEGDDAPKDGTDEPAILLYYWYAPRSIRFAAAEVARHVSYQRDVCALLELDGRVRVSPEGINGVLSSMRRSRLRTYVRRIAADLLEIVDGIGRSAGRDGDGDEDGDGDGERGGKTAETRTTTMRISRTVKDVEEEMDAKYCDLRKDLDAQSQMFDGLSVKETREVVSLCEPGADEQRNMSRARAKYARRCRGKMARGRLADGVAPSPSSLHPINGISLDGYGPARHLSPEEWNANLLRHCRRRRCRRGDDGDGNHDDDKDKDENDSDSGSAILVDVRNVYESRVGHFRVPGIPTLLTNTRKYSSLPSVLEAHRSELAGKHVYMYCTGGVRCERASAYLLALSDDGKRWAGGTKEEGAGKYDHVDKKEGVQQQGEEEEEGGGTGRQRLERPKGVYQLKGGIQRYLETFGRRYGGAGIVCDGKGDGDGNCEYSALSDGRLCRGNKGEDEGEEEEEEDGSQRTCLFRGKNFVFDPRRTDPTTAEANVKVKAAVAGTCASSGISSDLNLRVDEDDDDDDDDDDDNDAMAVVGRCLLCDSPWDDYDNGAAPRENREARCRRCRILVLVCDNCRGSVRAWGENGMEEKGDDTDEERGRDCEKAGGAKPELFCGPGGRSCVDQGNCADAVEILTGRIAKK